MDAVYWLIWAADPQDDRNMAIRKEKRGKRVAKRQLYAQAKPDNRGQLQPLNKGPGRFDSDLSVDGLDKVLRALACDA